MSIRRRSFIKYASLAAAGNIAGLKPFSAMNALAQSPMDYKALVCIFMLGGNDSNNLMIPFDTTGYANYSKIRGPLALAQSSLLQLGPSPNFALHPALAGVQTMYNSGAAAIVSNVGTLTQPTTRASYLAGKNLPENLFSHPDQQTEWENAAASGSTTTGWAGRISDTLRGMYNASASIPMITSVAGDSTFCNGTTTTPVSVAPGNVSGASCSEGAACAARLSAAQTLITLNSGVSLVSQEEHIQSNSYKYAATLTAATASAPPLTTVFPAGGFGNQLKQIAQIIQVRAALGVQRQIFFVGMGNFDTHSEQLVIQNSLLGGLSSALLAFYQATQEMGVANNVTTFTMSDFARTFQPNSNTGSDHGWGSHQLVMGGAVQGGKMYGTFPTLALGGSDDMGSNGRWVPTTASVQYASTMAQWFGVPTSQLAAVFPNIGNFTTNNLGFV